MQFKVHLNGIIFSVRLTDIKMEYSKVLWFLRHCSIRKKVGIRKYYKFKMLLVQLELTKSCSFKSSLLAYNVLKNGGYLTPPGGLQLPLTMITPT